MKKDLTDWEVGQDLVAIVDEMASRMCEFKDSHPDVHAVVKEAMLSIGDKFNTMESHGFHLPSHNLSTLNSSGQGVS